MVLWIFFGIGAGLIGFSGYLGIKYRYSGFDQNRFDHWRDKYLKKDPSAEEVEAKEWFKNNPNGAPTGQWLERKYLRELDYGKISAVIIGTIGGILVAVSSVF